MTHGLHTNAQFGRGLARALCGATAVLCTLASFGAAHASVLTAANAVASAAMQAVGVRSAQAQAAQTITFGALANQAYGTAPFTVSAIASSGLPVTFSSLTTLVCTVSGSTVTLVKVGGCTIRASQAGNASFAAAPSVDQHFNVTSGFGFLFNPAVSYATGAAPEGVVLGDFNGDGKLDAAVVNFSSSSVGIYIGHGDGTFTLGQTLSTGIGAVLIVTGDFNRDGKLDLAVTNVISNSVSIFLGNGNGTFGTGTQFPTGLGPFAIATADFNGDGKPDLVVSNGNTNTSLGGHTVSVLLGNGDGSFQSPVPYVTGTTPTSIVIADVNSDGKADLVVANSDDNNVGILLGHGDGTFAPQVTYAAGFHPHPVAVADFNGDGKLDLVVSHNLDPVTVSILLGNGDGTFGTATSFSPGSADGWVFVGDFNGDGQPDIGIASQLSGSQRDNAVFINLGNGDGTFQAPQVFSVGTTPLVAAVGDLNGDGKTDLVITNGFDNTISVLLHSANTGWPATVTSQSGTPQSTAGGTAFPAPLVVSVRDGTNNPLVGAVVAFTAPASGASGTFPGGLTVAKVTTNISGVASAPTFTANAAAGTFLVTARVGNFATTFALTNTQASQTINFSAPANKPLGTAPFTLSATATSGLTVTFSSLTTGVCTVSGNTVTLVATGTCTIRASQPGNAIYAPAPNVDQHFIVTTGAGSLFATTTNLAAASGPVGVMAGDFNRDGKPDIAVVSESLSIVSIYPGNGDGTLATGSTLSAGPRSYYGVVGDFNRDGKLDVAVTNIQNNTVSVFLGNGDGTFGPATQYPAGLGPYAIATADLNGDGKLDLVVTNGTDGSSSNGHVVAVMLGNGDGSFQAPVTYATGTYPVHIVVADFNGDGKPDLAVASALDAGVSILLGHGDGTFAPQATYSTNGGQLHLAAVDLNGDGKLDLVASLNTAIGNNVSILLGHGDGSFGAPTNFQLGNTPQAVVVGDFNGDGQSDLAIAFGADNAVDVALGNGDGTFQAPLVFGAGSYPEDIAVVDLNGDGKPDLVVSDFLGSGISILLHATNSGWPATVTSSAGTPQGANISTAYNVPLVVSVRDGSNNPLVGAVVVFTAPTSGATGTFTGGLSVVRVTTNTSGLAAAPTFTANATAGSFSVVATVGTFSTTFALTNGIQPAFTSGQPPSGTIGIAYSFTVIASGVPPPTISVSNGSLPPGLTLNGMTGVISGTPTAAGTFAATLIAVNGVVQAAAQGISIVIAPAPQTISFGTLASRALGSGQFTVSATASSGLAVTFSSQTTPVCTVSGSTVTLVAVGTCTIRASQAGNANFSAAPNVDQSFTVTQGSQTISFGALANKAVNAAPFTVSATASSGLAVSFSSQTTFVCTVAGNTVTLVAVGTCTIRASQPGDANFSAATPVDQSFLVTLASQAITFGALSDLPLGSAPFAVNATASSGLAVGFSSLTATCSVSGNTVTLVAGGLCTIRASQAGNATFSAAPDVDRSFTITQTSQTITFGALANRALGSGTFTVSATASSGLTVSFSSLTPAVCTVSGTTVTLLAGGTCTIRASQAGNISFGPAPNVDQSFTVTTPTVTLTAPANNATLTANSPITATASDPGAAITKVEFFIDGSAIPLQTFTSPPYTTTWDITSVANGPHTIKAVATDALQQTAQDTHNVTVQKAGDTTGPTVTSIQFNGVPLSSGDTVTSSGTLAFQVTDPSGVQSVQVKLDGNAIAGGSLAGSQYSIALDFGSVANGAHVITILATDTVGNPTTVSLNINVNLAAPPAPTITSPANGATVKQPTVSVSGTAAASSQVQLYLNGTATGSLINATSAGSFSGSLTLGAEGSYGIQADARNAHGTGPKSATTQITFAVAAPSVVFTSPPANATLSSATDISVSVVDAAGVSKVDFYIDGGLVGTVTALPYTYHWDVTAAADGSHALRAVATNTASKTGEATRSVTVQNFPPPPPPVLTSYTGEATGISPATSYGTQPIAITGRAKDRASGQPVPNATLRLVLQVGVFQRKITLATDASGAFAFNFVPQVTDAGTYIVSVIHPDETTLPNQGQFTINRVSFNYSSYSLNAARGFASTIPLVARVSPGSGVSGLRFVANPADQPSGNLPPGITIDGGSGITLPAGASAPITISFTGSTTAGGTGTIILTALASDSGSISRGSLRVDYRLSDPLPALYPTPTFIQTGVQQGSTVSATVSLQNKGLIATTGVQVQLQNSDGSSNVPAWIYLASANQLGTLDVGQTQTLQINAMPSTSVGDGIYNFRLHVTATNATGGDIPVAVSLTQAGQGNVVFDVADIYTNTLDTTGQPILGLANASIRIQNEDVLTVVSSATSDSQGIATVNNLPTGTYIYRASAPNHADTSGRILIRPGVTMHEHVFLDYNVVSIEFSVTETTIQDHYDVTLTATYYTVVPAPVVLIEPMSVNLPDLQVGEEYTGELTITNYGLVRADHVVFTPPSSDQYYQYEFLGTVPPQLEAKSRVSMPFRVTALQLQPQLAASLKTQAAKVLRFRAAAASGTCSSYGSPVTLTYDYICANGDTRGGSGNAGFHKFVGSTCGTGVGGGGGGGGTFDPGGFGGPLGGPTPIPLTPACTPDCPTCPAPGSSPGGG